MSILAILLRYLKNAVTEKKSKNVVLYLILLFCTIISSSYFYFNYESLLYRAGAHIIQDYVYAVLIILPLLFLIWKEGGITLSIMVFIFILYSFFGNFFPGFLFHEGLSVVRFLEVQVLGFEGIYGFISHVVGTWVAIFIIYAGLLQAFGSLDSIMKILLFIGKRFEKLVPQIPVLVSMIFASFSGSAAANVAGTGSFTIPVLMKLGFKPQFAGAIESVASSGGQIMPPIMGATAFLMSSILGEPYLKIMLIGFIPAILFYSSVGFSIYFLTCKISLKTSLVKDVFDQNLVKKDIFNLFPMILSLCVLLFSLGIIKSPLMKAALHGICSFLIAQFIYEMLTPRKSIIREFSKTVLLGANKSVYIAATIGLIGAAMGFIIKILTVTTLAPKLSFLIVDFSHGNLAILIGLVLIVSLIFGAALATLAVYILVVFLAAPALLDFGIEPIVSHFIIFYFGALSMITPPVGPAALVASGIAGVSFMSTAWQSMKLGLPLILLPLSFVVYPEIISVNAATPKAFIIVGLSLWFISFAIFSPSINRFSPIKKWICGLSGVFIISYPAKSLHIILAIIVILIFLIDLIIRKKATNF
jgi:TRAP transporter 4TM/12TM fusion protein